MAIDTVEGYQHFQTRNGPVETLLLLSPERTDEVCSVCNGTRKSVVRLLNQIDVIGVKPAGENVILWDEFKRKNPDLAADILASIEERGLRSPQCPPCMLDCYKPDTKVIFPGQ